MRRALGTYSIILLLSFLLAYFLGLLKPVGEASGGSSKLVVSSGQSFGMISAALKDRQLIRSKNIFKIYALVSGSATKLKPGNYELFHSFSTPEIIDLLVRGPEIDAQITVVEGDDLESIAGKLDKRGILNSKDFLNYGWQALIESYPFLQSARSLEGFLFPDTYRFFLNSSSEAVAKKFLDNFKKKARPLLTDWDGAKTDLDSYELLTLASLIEKEIPFHEDRLVVSGILRKRLAISMPLQVDAAPETYKKYGLPPGPIANPGLDAIYAALNPKNSDYLYYLSDPKTKKTIFSRTLDEHNENRIKYLGR